MYPVPRVCNPTRPDNRRDPTQTHNPTVCGNSVIIRQDALSRRRAPLAAGTLVAGDPPAAPSAAPPAMVSSTSLPFHAHLLSLSNRFILTCFSRSLSLALARSQFSIAAINESDTGGQWEPLAPTKEAQVGLFFLTGSSLPRICYHAKILALCFFSLRGLR